MNTYYECPDCGRALMKPGFSTCCGREVMLMTEDYIAARKAFHANEETNDPTEPHLLVQETAVSTEGATTTPQEEPTTPQETTAWGDKIDTHSSGAKRANGGKIRYDLLPIVAIRDTAEIWTFGADKYGDRNWEQGFDWSGPYASMMRHLQAWWAGEDFDAESGRSHLAHAACNLQMLQQFEYTYRQGDNRPAGTCPPPRIKNERQKNESSRNEDKRIKHAGKRPARW